jgi:hypothetical protein
MRPNKNLAQNADSDFLHFALKRRAKNRIPLFRPAL